jgi:hypothetical protein
LERAALGVLMPRMTLKIRDLEVGTGHIERPKSSAFGGRSLERTFNDLQTKKKKKRKSKPFVFNRGWNGVFAA